MRIIRILGVILGAVMVTVVPAGPTVGVKPVIVGSTAASANDVLLVAEPLGVVTVIVPVVAPAGTVVSIWLAVDDVAVAVTPLNCTVFWLGVVLNAVP